MVGNQLPILLIDFRPPGAARLNRWESVTNPLDRLLMASHVDLEKLGISYQSS